MIAQVYDQQAGVLYDTNPHQFEAYEHLEQNRRAALFLEMSLSKTVVALSYLYDMHYKEVAFLKTLVIAPDKVARVTWPDEIAKWAHLNGLRYSLIAGTAKERLAALAVDAEVYILGVDNTAWLMDLYITQRVSKNTGLAYGEWRGRLPFDSVLIDELDYFKNRSSKRYEKLARALKLSEIDFRIGMTGTPMTNGYVDLWAQIKLLDDGKRLGDTFGEFESKYFKMRGNGMITYEWIPKPDTPKILANKVKDIALSMKTRDYLKLPALRIIDEELSFDPFDMETYEELEREYILEFDSARGSEYWDDDLEDWATISEAVTVKTPADLSNKLLQISSGAVYADKMEGEKGPKVWHELNTLKLDALEEIVNEYPEENLIVVYQFRHEVDRIMARFPYARQFRSGKHTKTDVDDWNSGKIKMLIIHPAGAGHGLNLQFGGRRMVWFSVTWNLGHWLQTVARILRRGALKEIFVHRLIVKGTCDEKVRKRIYTKDTNQTFLQNTIKELRNKIYGKVRK